jgi:hypothetical protein
VTSDELKRDEPMRCDAMNVAWRVNVLVALLLPAFARSNDAAAEVAAGGVQLRVEHRVTMAKERLYIGSVNVERTAPNGRKYSSSRATVRVEYEFLNDSSEDVATEVAFPVPPLKYQGVGTSPTNRFDDFRVWADGAAITPKKDVRALLDGRDVTDSLTKLGVTIEDFGGFDYEDDAKAFKGRLSPEKLAALSREKLVDAGDLPWPKWQVQVTYHWNQNFPARKTVQVRHEYTPAYGFGQVQPSDLPVAHRDGCFERSVIEGLTRRGGYVGLWWVKYILTTANTWRTPIGEFELVVERPEGRHASFCWDGIVERIGKTTFRASAKNFVPANELTVYFY